MLFIEEGNESFLLAMITIFKKKSSTFLEQLKMSELFFLFTISLLVMPQKPIL